MIKWVTIIFVIAVIALGSAYLLDHERIIDLGNGSSESQTTEKAQPDFAFLALGQVGEGQGGKWHYSPELTDSIIFVYYQPFKKTVNLVSIPRDLYGKFGDESFKINEAIKRNKISELLNKVSEITGTETEKYLMVDLSVVKKGIDTIGGVDVNLLVDAIDWVSGYRMKAGPQHLNGEDAVWLIRNRAAPEGDFFREKNQQLVIESVFKKYQELSKLEKIKLFFELTPELKNADTNITPSEIFTLSQNADSLNFKNIVLDFSTNLLKSSSIMYNASSSAYILVPQKGIDNYEDINKFINDKLMQ